MAADMGENMTVCFGLLPSWERLNDPDFRFVEGELPLTSFTQAFVTVACYVAFVFSLKAFMGSREPVRARWLTVFSYYHNMFLFLLSAFMVVAIIYENYLIMSANDLDTMVCDLHSRLFRGRVVWWYYIFYLSKFYELLDTVIIVLKKRPVIFLHWYHHFITLLVVWMCLKYGVAGAWLAIIANCSVHIFMYYYFMRMARGEEADKAFGRRFKRYITSTQIVQFILDEGVFLWHLKRSFEENWECGGGLASVFGAVVLTSFLVLFLAFYSRSYGESFIRWGRRKAQGKDTQRDDVPQKKAE